jgi:hypothetical protein
MYNAIECLAQTLSLGNFACDFCIPDLRMLSLTVSAERFCHEFLIAMSL